MEPIIHKYFIGFQSHQKKMYGVDVKERGRRERDMPLIYNYLALGERT